MYFIPGLAHSYSHSGQDIEAPNIFTQSRLFFEGWIREVFNKEKNDGKFHNLVRPPYFAQNYGKF